MDSICLTALAGELESVGEKETLLASETQQDHVWTVANQGLQESSRKVLCLYALSGFRLGAGECLNSPAPAKEKEYCSSPCSQNLAREQKNAASVCARLPRPWRRGQGGPWSAATAIILQLQQENEIVS